MTPDLVSTIIPVYNRPARLREAVASVLAQDWRPIEVLIVDDGSTDEGATRATAHALAAEHPDIVRVFTQANAGPGAARELGRQHAKGEFLQYLDSDDVLLPGKFRAQVHGLREDLVAGISYGLTIERHEKTGVERPTQGTDTSRRAIFPHALCEPLWPTVAPLYRRSVTDDIGPWKPRRILEDWDYDLRAGLLGVRLHYVAEPVAVVRVHAQDHAGLAWQHDARALADRVQAYLDAAALAREVGLPPDTPELRRLGRTLFWMAREAGALGLPHEARSLFCEARRILGDDPRQSVGLSAYRAAVAVVGWRAAGRLSRIIDRLKSA
ncbi:MAG: glycosyltransferase family 2 protein [Casimicrobiaceae bacterium]